MKVIEFTRTEMYYPAVRSWSPERQDRARKDESPIAVKIQEWLDANPTVTIISVATQGEGYNHRAMIVYKP